MPDMTKFYTVADLAEFFGKSAKTVYRMIHNGQIQTEDSIGSGMGSGKNASRPILVSKDWFHQKYPQFPRKD